MPQRSVVDRIVWSKSIDGLYNVKTGYRVWHDQFAGNFGCTQSGGWSCLWRLSIPHNIKIFIWRLCRDNVHVRIRLMIKGIAIPIISLMCNVDIEHPPHLFFDCPFASNCWHAANLNYDMMEVFSAPEWQLNKLEVAKHEEIVKICVVLGGIWFWRDKKVWNN